MVESLAKYRSHTNAASPSNAMAVSNSAKTAEDRAARRRSRGRRETDVSTCEKERCVQKEKETL
jgi:hypothetical protein